MRRLVACLFLLCGQPAEADDYSGPLQAVPLTYHSSGTQPARPEILQVSQGPRLPVAVSSPAVSSPEPVGSASPIPPPPPLTELPSRPVERLQDEASCRAHDRVRDWTTHPTDSWFRFTMDDLQPHLTSPAECGEVVSRTVDLSDLSDLSGLNDAADGCGSECGEPIRPCSFSPSISFTAGSIFLKREDPSGTVLFTNTLNTQRLRAGDFNFGVEAGVDLRLVHHQLIEGADLEVRYFSVGDWKDRVHRNLSGGPIRLNLATPVGLSGSRTTHNSYTSELSSLEINVVRGERTHTSGIRTTAGFRYLSLDGRLFSVLYGAGGAADALSSRTSNRLYGLQLGLDATVAAGPGYQLDSYARFGIFGAEADARTTLSALGGGSMAMVGRGNHTAIMGEWGLKARAQLTDRTHLFGGYQVILLDGVALASNQLPLSQPGTGRVSLDHSSVFFHGATFGVEFCY